MHLKGRTETNGNPLYSAENAPGIIMATGNTGIYLEEDSDLLNTYLSRDGGHNWFEVIFFSFFQNFKIKKVK